MNKEVESAVDSWLGAFKLPAPPSAGMKDLLDRPVRVAKFLDEETCRFFFPQRSLFFHQRMVKRVAFRLRRRGALFQSVYPKITDYTRWCERTGHADTVPLRFEYASTLPDELLP